MKNIGLCLIIIILLGACEKNNPAKTDPIVHTQDSILQIKTFKHSKITIYEYGSPDTSAYLDLDIDMDSSYDFRLQASYKYSFMSPSCDESFTIRLSSISDLSQLAIEAGPCNAMSADTGTFIDENLSWAKTAWVYFRDCQVFTSNCGKRDPIIMPLSLTIDGNEHFGWVEFEYSYYDAGGAFPYDSLSVQVKQHVLNLRPNAPLIVQ